MQSRVSVRGLAIVGTLALAATLWAQGGAPTQPATQAATQPLHATPISPTTGPTAVPSGAPPRVVLEIGCGGESWGRIVIEVYPHKVPITVENFLQYVDSGFYDGTIFHRVIPGYLIQGGGYTSLSEPKRTGLRRAIRSEAKSGLKNARGTVAMARARNPASATSQFFINLEQNPNLDYPNRDGWGYCAFGNVVEGMEVVDRIAAVPTQLDEATRVDRSPSQPIDPPVIMRAYRLGGPVSRPALVPPPELMPQEPPAPEAEGDNQEPAPEETPEDRPPPEPENSEPARP
jgi:cyclophilin family peptidyl-prolyl cis-trans isomerase